MHYGRAMGERQRIDEGLQQARRFKDFRRKKNMVWDTVSWMRVKSSKGSSPLTLDLHEALQSAPKIFHAINPSPRTRHCRIH